MRDITTFKPITRVFTCALITIAVLFLSLPSEDTEAAPRRNKLRAAKQAASQVVRAEKRLRSTYRQLSAADKAKLVTSLRSRSTTSEDSDDDTFPDLVDTSKVAGTNTCSSDSDGDGLDDGSEVDDKSDPNDSDSDDDGYDDSEDTHDAKGIIESYAGQVLTVNGMAFTVVLAPNPQPTEFKDLDVDDLEVGTCVEVEGYLDGANLRAVKVSSEDSCSGSGSSSSSGSDD